MKERIICLLAIFMLTNTVWAGTWKDDFEDGNLNGWRMGKIDWINVVYTPNAGNWRVENGVVIGGDDNKYMIYGLYMGEMSWTDYTVKVSVKFSKELRNCETWSAVYLGVRGQEPFPYMNYSLGMQHFGSSGRKQILVEDGKMVPTPVEAAGGIICPRDPSFAVHQFPKVLLNTKTDIWYRLKVTVNGNLVKCFIDGKQVNEFQDARYSSGVPGFSVCGVVAIFDDFMVTGPDIPNGGPGFVVHPRTKLASTWGRVKQMDR